MNARRFVMSSLVASFVAALSLTPVLAMEAMPGVKPQSGKPQAAAAMPAVGEAGKAGAKTTKQKKTTKAKKRTARATHR